MQHVRYSSNMVRKTECECLIIRTEQDTSSLFMTASEPLFPPTSNRGQSIQEPPIFKTHESHFHVVLMFTP